MCHRLLPALSVFPRPSALSLKDVALHFVNSLLCFVVSRCFFRKEEVQLVAPRCAIHCIVQYGEDTATVLSLNRICAVLFGCSL